MMAADRRDLEGAIQKEASAAIVEKGIQLLTEMSTPYSSSEAEKLLVAFSPCVGSAPGDSQAAHISDALRALETDEDGDLAKAKLGEIWAGMLLRCPEADENTSLLLRRAVKSRLVFSLQESVSEGCPTVAEQALDARAKVLELAAELKKHSGTTMLGHDADSEKKLVDQAATPTRWGPRFGQREIQL